MKDEILISVVLPFYNGKEFVKETLESIASQTFANFEVIVVDDGSANKEHTEYLHAAIRALNDPRFKYFYKDNGGLSSARNFGLKAAAGSWIAFIDQDDLWDAKKLERQIAVAKAHPEAKFVFSDGKMIGDVNEDMKVASKNGLREGFVKDTYTRLLKGNFVICSSVLFDKRLLEKTGYSNPCFKIVPDYEYILRFAAQTDFYFVRDSLVSYRVHGANTVRNQLKQSAEVVSLLCDLDLATRMQKVLATYNLTWNILTIGSCWIKKIF
jgi:glycosyltransferase involved in cell wall biosynthesis